MFTKIAGGAGILALFTLAGAAGLGAQERPFEWSGSMGDGQLLEVKGIVGSIHAVLASGARAEVVARKRGTDGDFEEVAIEVEEVGDGFVICAVYGSWNHGQEQCLPDRRDRRDDRGRERHRGVNIDVEVEFEVRVPAGVEFHGNMISGGIRVEDLRSEVDVNTVSGDIFVSSSEMVWANSVSGDIEVEMGSFDWDEMDFSTVSGDILLWLPGDFAADIDFNSLSGDFDTDFDLSVRNQRKRRWVGTNLEGSIGGGGPELSINTISGDVDLRRKGG